MRTRRPQLNHLCDGERSAKEGFVVKYCRIGVFPLVATHFRVPSLLLAYFLIMNLLPAVTVAQFTRLHDAARVGDQEAVSRLIADGADVNAKDDDGSAALFLASAGGHAETVMTLLAAGAHVNAKHIVGATALQVASQEGHGTVVTALLAAGADVNAKRESGETALMGASFEGHSEIVTTLLSAGADVDAKAYNGTTALMGASQMGFGAVVAELLAAGANVNASTNNGITALWLASNEGHSAIVIALLAAGADVNARTNSGWTPLMLAVRNGQQVAAEVLLAGGADPFLENAVDGTNAIAVAVRRWEAAPSSDRDEELRLAAMVAEAAGIDTSPSLPLRAEQPWSPPDTVIRRAQEMLAALGYGLTPDGRLGPRTIEALASFRATNPQEATEQRLTEPVLRDLELATTPFMMSTNGGVYRRLETRCRFRIQRTNAGTPLVTGGCRSDLSDSRRAGMAESIIVGLWAVPPGYERTFDLLMDGQGLATLPVRSEGN